MLRELSPIHIGNAFGQLVMAHHVFHLQAFQDDDWVFVNNPGSQFVREILTHIGNLGLKACHLRTGFVSVKIVSFRAEFL